MRAIVPTPLVRAPLAVLALLPVLLLASCGGDAPAEGEAGGATGEILEASVSDAMIATDAVKSQPPLIKEAPASAAVAGEGEEAAAEGEDGAVAESAEPAAAEPAPAAE